MVIKNHAFWSLSLAAALAISLSLGLPGCGDEELPQRLLSDCIDSTQPPIDIPTAGLRGILLTVDAECHFQIDPHVDCFNWSSFVQQYGNVNPRVRIKVSINKRGTVDSVFGIRDGGHPAAAELIKNNVELWRFEGGCLMGVIYYEFNTRLSRLNVDASRLVPAPGFEQCDIEVGRMHRVCFGGDLGVRKRSLDW